MADNKYIIQLLDIDSTCLAMLIPAIVSEFRPDQDPDLAYEFSWIEGTGTMDGSPVNIRVYKDFTLLCKLNCIGWPYVTSGRLYSAKHLSISRALLDGGAIIEPKVCGCGLRAAGCGGIHQDYCDLAGMSEPMTY